MRKLNRLLLQNLNIKIILGLKYLHNLILYQNIEAQLSRYLKNKIDNK